MKIVLFPVIKLKYSSVTVATLLWSCCSCAVFRPTACYAAYGAVEGNTVDAVDGE